MPKRHEVHAAAGRHGGNGYVSANVREKGYAHEWNRLNKKIDVIAVAGSLEHALAARGARLSRICEPFDLKNIY